MKNGKFGDSAKKKSSKDVNQLVHERINECTKCLMDEQFTGRKTLQNGQKLEQKAIDKLCVHCVQHDFSRSPPVIVTEECKATGDVPFFICTLPQDGFKEADTICTLQTNFAKVPDKK